MSPGWHCVLHLQGGFLSNQPWLTKCLLQETRCPILAMGATFYKAQQYSSAKRGAGGLLKFSSLANTNSQQYSEISLLPGGATAFHYVWRRNEMVENLWFLTQHFSTFENNVFVELTTISAQIPAKIYLSPWRMVERIWWTFCTWFSTLGYLLVKCKENMKSVKRDLSKRVWLCTIGYLLGLYEGEKRGSSLLHWFDRNQWIVKKGQAPSTTW